MAHFSIPLEVRFHRIPTEWEIQPPLSVGNETTKRMLIPKVTEGKASLLDGWHLRDRFLKLKHTEDEALSFLNDAGLWMTVPKYPGTPGGLNGEGFVGERSISETAVPVTLHRFWQAQEGLSKYLLNPKLWESRLDALASQDQDVDDLLPVAFIVFGQALPLKIGWRGSRPIGVIDVTTAVQLLHASTHIDLIRGAKFKLCARPDCRAPFPILSGHERKYCEWYCGHIESVRRRREDIKRQQKGAHHDKKKRTR